MLLAAMSSRTRRLVLVGPKASDVAQVLQFLKNNRALTEPSKESLIRLVSPKASDVAQVLQEKVPSSSGPQHRTAAPAPCLTLVGCRRSCRAPQN